MLDNQAGALFGFVAELSADGQALDWTSLVGGDLFQPERIALGPDNTIHLGGKSLRHNAKSYAAGQRPAWSVAPPQGQADAALAQFRFAERP